MSWLSGFFIYLLIWWIMLFTILPMGVRQQKESDKGFDAGAPEKPDLKKKLLLNTFVSAVIVGIIQVLVLMGVIDWRGMFDGTLK